MNPQQLFHLAQSLHQNRKYEEAKGYYLQLLEKFPEHTEGLHFLGILLSQKGEFANAISYLEKAVNFAPQNSVYWINLAEALTRNQQKEKAIEALKQAIKLSPERVEALFNLGQLYHDLGHYVLAKDYYHEVIRLQPRHPRALLNLANIYNVHRLFNTANEYLNLYLQIYPQHQEVRAQMEGLQKVSSDDEVLIKQTEDYQGMSQTYPDLKEGQVIHSYVELLKKCLTHTLHLSPQSPGFQRLAEGMNWSIYAETMIGRKRLDNIHYCVAQVLQKNIPGDVIETGAWRGGASILMRGILKAYQNKEKTVWVCDSFEGLPAPDIERYPHDQHSTFHLMSALKVPLQKVQANFRKYDLLDGQVKFLKGWFKDTLPIAPIEQLAVLRLDGDMYESTMDSLTHLYPKLVKGGYILIDDYGVIPACKAAVEDYREQYKITTPIIKVDYTGVYWQKE